MSKILTVSTNKGGVLKSSICSNLAGVYSQEEKRVLVVDMDNQGNAALSFGINPDDLNTTIYDVLVDEIPAQYAIVQAYENIDILPSNDDLAFLEFDVLANLEKYKDPFMLLRKSLEPILSNYDIILIDTPPNLGLAQGNALSSADEVLIPFQPENYSMRSLVKILNAIDQFRERYNPGLDVLGVLATLVDKRTILHSQILQECRAYCINNDVRMFDTIIPRSVRFASSIAYEGLPSTLTDKTNALVGSYYDLVREMCEDEPKQK